MGFVGSHTAVTVMHHPHVQAIHVAEAQSLELLLAGMLGLATSPDSDRPVDELSEDVLSRTLGNLARRIRELTPDDQTAAVLDEVVEKRNYLVHRCLRKYGWPMSTIEEYGEAVRELDGIRTLLRNSGDAVALALQRAQALDIILVRTNSETGKPELVE